MREQWIPGSFPPPTKSLGTRLFINAQPLNPPQLAHNFTKAVNERPDCFVQFGHMLSVGAICFEDRFCASRKGGTGGGGWVHRFG